MECVWSEIEAYHREVFGRTTRSILGRKFWARPVCPFHLQTHQTHQNEHEFSRCPPTPICATPMCATPMWHTHVWQISSETVLVAQILQVLHLQARESRYMTHTHTHTHRESGVSSKRQCEMCVCVCVCVCVMYRYVGVRYRYVLASISRLLKIMGLFCERAL